jgi:SUN domain-containing protein 1/2
VVATEKRATSVELLGANEASPAQPSPTGGNDTGTNFNGKDLSHHSILGERSSRDLAAQQAKKPVANTTNATLRRARKPPPHKPEQPRWVTVFRVFAKNFVLLVVLAGLVQLIRRLAVKPSDAVSEIGLSEFEGRIAELEAFVKTTVKMTQVQVELVDRKIGNEIGGLRKEMSEKIENQGQILGTQVKELETRSEELERSIGGLKAVEWLSKEEFEKILEDLKRARSVEYGDGNVGLDEIRVFARMMIEREIEKHAADGLGRVDYAQAAGGAVVAKHSEPYLAGGKATNWFLMGSRNAVHSNAERMLRPSFGEPGQCFALRGSSGFVQIRLRTAIVPEAVTLEHVAKVMFSFRYPHCESFDVVP